VAAVHRVLIAHVRTQFLAWSEFYNQRRRHLTLGQISPAVFEKTRGAAHGSRGTLHRTQSSTGSTRIVSVF
jgi:hypothetical protein